MSVVCVRYRNLNHWTDLNEIWHVDTPHTGLWWLCNLNCVTWQNIIKLKLRSTSILFGADHIFGPGIFGAVVNQLITLI
jgi:hypothetical protein